MAKVVESKNIRTVGLFGHRASGKTSLAEAIVFTGKLTTRLGSVDAKTSIFDYTDEEQSRGFTISPKPGWVEWAKKKINFIDTPGDLNFMTEAGNVLQVVDLALFVVSAAGGVEVGTEKLWDQAATLGLPRMVLINKLDRERTQASAILKELEESFHGAPIAMLQIPLGQAAQFNGVVDLITGKAHRYASDGSGQAEEIEIPGALAKEVEAAREKLIEKVAETSEALTEKYLETLELSQEDLMQGLRSGLRTGSLIPVVLGSSTANIGISRMLDLIAEYGPNPLEHAAVQAYNTKDEAVSVTPSEEGSPLGLVFKTMLSRSGKFNYFRVFRGKFSANAEIYNSTSETSERLGSLVQFQGKNQENVDEAVPGDIIGVAKLKATNTGDTFCGTNDKLQFRLIQKPIPLISFALHGEDEDKIFQGLARIAEEDTALILERDPYTNEILLRGQGQIHVEVIIERLRNQLKSEVQLHPPSVAYKETIRGRVTGVEGKLKKQSGGRGQFAVCFIEMYPAEPGTGFVFEDAIVGGVIPKQYIPAVEKGVIEAAARGSLAGYPTIDYVVKLYDGKFHDVDSSENAFKMAGIFAFRNAVEKCKAVILEPIMMLDVTVPADYQGAITGDLNSRRGRLEGTEYRGKNVTIRAKVPEAEILTYANQLISMTEGRGSFTVKFSHYEQTPPPIQAKIVEKAKVQQEES